MTAIGKAAPNAAGAGSAHQGGQQRGGMAAPTGLAAHRWAKSARTAMVRAGKALALVQSVERQESERTAGRPRLKVVNK